MALAKDFNGVTRPAPVGSGIDLGAIESVMAMPYPVISSVQEAVVSGNKAVINDIDVFIFRNKINKFENNKDSLYRYKEDYRKNYYDHKKYCRVNKEIVKESVKESVKEVLAEPFYEPKPVAPPDPYANLRF